MDDDVSATRARPITQAQAALIDAGFRPARHSGAVRLARRLLWPLVRPFHFHTLDRADSAARDSAAAARETAETREELARDIAALREDLARTKAHARELSAECRRLAQALAAQRGECVALANRLVALEDGTSEASATESGGQVPS